MSTNVAHEGSNVAWARNFPNQHFHLPQKTLVVLQTILDDFSKSFHPRKPFTKEDVCQEIIVKKWYFGYH
jgi:hypothetical protein